MSTAILEEPKNIKKQPQSTAMDVVYTICLVFVASNVAVELGWVEEELKKAGARLEYLFAGKEVRHWLPHFDHKLDNLFRDGGNIPSIWAKADNTDTTLIGLTGSTHGGQVLVRTDSGVDRVGDLRGRRIALYQSGNPNKIDWWRATAERGILLALNIAGLRRKDVQIVNVADDHDHGWGVGTRPSEVWASRTLERTFGPEVRAVREGRADALYTSHGRALSLQETGEFKVIEDLGRYPDWTLQVNNSPYAITVNTELAQSRPEIVVAFLRATLRAGRWINANRDAAAAILHRVTFYPSVADTVSAIANSDFVPNLSPKNLAGIDLTKQFLLEKGYIRRDFDAKEWANTSFLEEALRSL